jgi:urea transport system ATP-binding protein
VSVLTVSRLNQSYGGSHTLWDVDLEVKKGSRTCLMGRNGTGKTTLLKCIMGLVHSESGSMAFGGTALGALPAEARARLGIAYVPQGREIFPQLTVEENLRVGLGIRAGGPRSIPARIFELFPVLKQMLGRRGGDLSGGQQQQLAIGRALVMRPKLLVLDEPTEGIQPSIIKDIGRAIRYLRDQAGIAVLLVEQYLDFCRELADQVNIMERGQIVHTGPAEDLDKPEVRKLLTV